MTDQPRARHSARTRGTTMAAKSTFAHTCHRCGAAIAADQPPDGQNSFCTVCLGQNLRDIDPLFLEDYMYFGAKARATSAGLYLNLFHSTDDVRVCHASSNSVLRHF